MSVVSSMFSWCSMAQALHGLGNWEVGGKGRGLGREGGIRAIRTPFCSFLLPLSSANFLNG